MSMKNPLTQAGIKPVTFQFEAQHLNHCATAVPIIKQILKQKGMEMSNFYEVSRRGYSERKNKLAGITKEI